MLRWVLIVCTVGCSTAVRDDISSGASTAGAGASGAAGAGASGAAGTGASGPVGTGGTASSGVSTGGAGGTSGAGPCGADAVCVAPAPLGWTGPLAVWTGQGTAPLPDCAGAGLVPEATAYSTIDGWPAASCSACSCTDSPNADCQANFYHYPFSGCGGMFNNGATVTEACTVFAGTGTASISMMGMGSGGTPCDASGGVATLSVPAEVTKVHACSGLPTGATCGQGDICAFTPPAPMESAPCIFKTGNQSCPAEYPVKRWFSTVNDTRGCDPCDCQQPANCTVDVFPASASCGGAAVNLAGCINVGATFSAKTNWACASGPSGGAPMGSVSVADEVTICCVP